MTDEQHLEEGFRALRSLRRIIRQVGAHSRSMARDSGLTLPQLVCMRAVRSCTDEEVTVAAVADAVSLSRSTVSVVAEKLVQGGLLNRDRSPRDRRRVHLSLTDEGERRLQEMPLPLQDRFLQRLGALPAAEREALLQALETVVEMMDAEDLDAAPMLVPGIDLSRS